MSRWFRHYAGMMRDDKLVRAAMLSKQSVERVVWIWGAILESAAEVNDAGRYDFDAAEAAYFLRSDESDISAVVDALTKSGRLADGRVVNWSARQFESDRSAPRQAAYRERKRTTRGDGDNKQTTAAQPSDAPVTSPSRHGDAPETETYPEKEETEDANASSAEDGFAERSDHERLRTSGVEWLAKVTHRKPQALQGVVGRWLKQTGDDAAAVLGVLRDARDRQIAEPIAWIEAALKAKPSPAQPPPMDWQERAEWYRKLGRWPAYWGSRDSVPKESRHLFPGVFDELQVAS